MVARREPPVDDHWRAVPAGSNTNSSTDVPFNIAWP